MKETFAIRHLKSCSEKSAAVVIQKMIQSYRLRCSLQIMQPHSLIERLIKCVIGIHELMPSMDQSVLDIQLTAVREAQSAWRSVNNAIMHESQEAVAKKDFESSRKLSAEIDLLSAVYKSIHIASINYTGNLDVSSTETAVATAITSAERQVGLWKNEFRTSDEYFESDKNDLKYKYKSKQDIFNTVVDGLASQQWRASYITWQDSEGNVMPKMCSYRSTAEIEGKQQCMKCAAGWLISDHEYDEFIESGSVAEGYANLIYLMNEVSLRLQLYSCSEHEQYSGSSLDLAVGATVKTIIASMIMIEKYGVHNLDFIRRLQGAHDQFMRANHGSNLMRKEFFLLSQEFKLKWPLQDQIQQSQA